MTAPNGVGAVPAWHDEGMRAASALDAVSSALVIGRDPEIAAWVALGLARAQAAHRRVAVGDLVGEIAPLQSLVEGDDPHGITDSFTYGVSLNRIARPADASGNLFILPSGSEPVASEEILRSDRWRRLAGGFREVGALLLLVVQADTPGLEELAASVEGVVHAGDATGVLPDAPPPLAVVAPPSTRRGRGAPTAAAGVPTRETGDVPATTQTSADGRGEATVAPRTAPDPAPSADGGSRRRLVPALAIGAGALALALGALFYLRPTPAGESGAEPVVRADSGRTAAASGPAVAARPDGGAGADTGAARRDSAPAAAAPRPGETLPALTLANPADSARAAAFAVYVVSSNTPEGATVDPQVDLATLPVPALTPVLERGAPWYRLLVGASTSRQEAEALLADLRRRRVLGAGSGSIVRAPYALLVAEAVPAAQAGDRVQALARKNIPVYPLSRGDGTVNLYAGAFETPDQAAFLARNLQGAGVRPVLVYRTGRSL